MPSCNKEPSKKRLKAISFNTANGNALLQLIYITLRKYGVIDRCFNTASGNALLQQWVDKKVKEMDGIDVSIPQAVIPCCNYHLFNMSYKLIGSKFQYRKR